MGWTDAAFGDAKKSSVRQKFFESFNFSEHKSEHKLVGCQQTHGDRVAFVESAHPQVYGDTDGLVTDRTGLALSIYTADCVPIFIASKTGSAVGIVHAGWRGMQKQIALKALRLLEERCKVSPKNLEFYVGPHIQECCYSVGADVQSQFNPQCFRQGQSRGGQSREEQSRQEQLRVYFSLNRALAMQLESAKVPSENIRFHPDCTHCDKKYHSFRRDKTEQRMVSLIAIKGKNYG